MKKILSALVLSAVASCGAVAPATAENKNVEKMQSEMLDPAVQVDRSSGIVISTAGAYIYILTAHHVVNKYLDIDNYGSGMRVEVRNPVPVKFFKDNEENFTRTGRIIAYDSYSDLALLQVKGTDEDVEGIAALYDEADEVKVFQDSWSIGSGLGEHPFPTAGMISDINYPRSSVSNLSYILSSADITFGNSGGGLYVYDEKDDRYELVGVNVMMRAHSISPFTPPTPMTHMGVAVSYKDIADFLRTEGWEQFLESE